MYDIPIWTDFIAFSVVDYDAMRAEAKDVFDSKIAEVHVLVARLQKTQRAAEQALDLSVLFYVTTSDVSYVSGFWTGMNNIVHLTPDR